MPYASEKQRRYMESQEPEIAAKWRKKGHAYVKKNRGDWAKAIGAGTAAGALANQFPRIQDVERDRKRKKKGQIKKAYDVLVHSDDPEFNHAAAQKAFDLVMKMDDDSAQMFTLIAMSEMFETDITKNLRTLQGHLNEVISKRLAAIGKAVDSSIAKGDHPDAEGYGKALTEITKAVVNPYISGLYDFKESDFRRDPHSGQFQAKIKHKQKVPFKGDVADQMGLRPQGADDKKKYKELSREDKAKYQDEYRQLSAFLSTVTQSSQAGDQNILLRYEDKKTGNEFRVPHTSGDADGANEHLLNPRYTLLAAEANPAGLTAGGAGFALAQAMGMQHGDRTGSRLEGVKVAENNLGTFSEGWLASNQGEAKQTNARLYNRTATAGSYIGMVAPNNSKTQAAAQLAQVVGSHGPEAEAVIGPTARRTAYRYRGTEKTPDKHIVDSYNRAIRTAKLTGAGAPLVDEQELLLRNKSMAKPAVGEVGVGASRRATTMHGVDTPASAPAGFGQSTSQAAQRALTEARPPTWAERAQGRKAVIEQLKNSKNFPRKSLYELQTKSGNTPPSEGILMNSKGQIVTQAVGYGDDHYLPFNLKNLKNLKGGEYVRTRSVGGLTSEDIYTGLITGARRVTVVSRSGTFSVEFEPDFRGGRRYNDKALRMTRRYEQILDAVQSKQVSSGAVPVDVQDALRAQVLQDYPYEKSRKALNAKYTTALEEFRADPELGPQDEKMLRFITAQVAERNPSKSEQEWLNAAKIKVMQGKRVNYQLDAQGYEAAQDSLAEQFPYYITSHPIVEVEPSKMNYEKDKGYVEPGRVLPTAAMGGLYGTSTNLEEGEDVGNRKYSQSQANYQRGRIGPGKGDTSPEHREGTERRQSGVPAPRVTPGEAPAETDAPAETETEETEEGTTPEAEPAAAETVTGFGLPSGGAGTPAAAPAAGTPAAGSTPARPGVFVPAPYRRPGAPAAPATTPAAPGATPSTPAATTPAATPAPGSPSSASTNRARNENQFQDAAYELFTELKENVKQDAPERTTEYGDIFALNDNQFLDAWSQNQGDFRDRFQKLVVQLGNRGGMPAGNPKVQAYHLARNQVVNRTPSGPGLAQYWSKQPQAFEGPGYQPTDTDEKRNSTAEILDRRTHPVTVTSALSELADVDGGLEREHKVLRQIYGELKANPRLSEPGSIDERNEALKQIFQGAAPPDQAVRLLSTSTPDELVERMMDVQRMRTVRAHYKGAWPFKVGGPPPPFGTPPPGYEVARRSDGRPHLQLVDSPGPEPTKQSEDFERHKNKNLVLNRVKVLRRWRAGLETDSPIETEGDQSLIDAEAMLQRFIPGRTPPRADEVEAFLDATAVDFKTNPGALDELHPGEVDLLRYDPDTFLSQFVMGDDGHWKRDRGDQESAE